MEVSPVIPSIAQVIFPIALVDRFDRWFTFITVRDVSIRDVRIKLSPIVQIELVQIMRFLILVVSAELSRVSSKREISDELVR